MEILHWKIDQALEKEAQENYRTNYALALKDKDPLSIVRELTFDGVVPNITIKDIEDNLKLQWDWNVIPRRSDVNIKYLLDSEIEWDYKQLS